MRSLAMQSLTAAIKRRWPGVVVYGIGDHAHQLAPSDHNEDDTPGSHPAQSDTDRNPEHRAIDVMLGPAFSRADGYALVNALVGDAASRKRLFYIIFDSWLWSRSYGWVKQRFSGDPHRDHPHISGWAANDEDSSGWPMVDRAEGEDDVSWSEKLESTPSTEARFGRGDKSAKSYLQRAAIHAYDGARAASQAAAAVTALRGVVEDLAATIRAGGGSVDTAAILAGVDKRLSALPSVVAEAVVDEIAS